ncbi:MAG: peptidylprolyl isomerase [Phycisphaerae bacterium]
MMLAARSVFIGLSATFLGMVSVASAQNTPPATAPAATSPAAATPAAVPSGSGKPKATIEVTQGDQPLGRIVVELDAEMAPITVQNFIQYAQAKFYDGTIFHRVMPTFMIQGGGHLPNLDEKKDGLRPEIKNEWKNGLKNVRGAIAMARKDAADSASAQFFINVVDNARLDMPISGGAAYCVFGKVVEGMDVVDKIKDTKCVTNPKYPSPQPVVPENTVLIKSLTISDAPSAAQCEEWTKTWDARLKAAAEKQLTDVLAKIEKDAGKKPEKTTSGIYYVVLKEGSGESPTPTDTVEVHYTGWLLDGTKFDSSVDSGKPAKFRLTQVIKGWVEGVGMMKPGEKRKFLIPPELAYGAAGRPGIPPNAWLHFDIELISVAKP